MCSLSYLVCLPLAFRISLSFESFRFIVKFVLLKFLCTVFKTFNLESLVKIQELSKETESLT